LKQETTYLLEKLEEERVERLKIEKSYKLRPFVWNDEIQNSRHSFQSANRRPRILQRCDIL